MPDVMIATKTGVLRGPDGQQYRIARGRTTAHSTHPAVAAEPRVWVPMPVNLAVPESADTDDAERYAAQLQRLADGLRERGIEAEDDTREGWLVDAVLAVLDRAAGEQHDPTCTDDSHDHTTSSCQGPAADDHDQDGAEQRAAIRAWAAEQGIEVSPRGKIPAAVVEQYQAAHSG